MKCPLCQHKFHYEKTYPLENQRIGLDCPECGAALERDAPAKYHWLFLVKAVSYPLMLGLLILFGPDGYWTSPIIIFSLLGLLMVWIGWVVVKIIKGARLRVRVQKS